jgi:hypothetical protein
MEALTDQEQKYALYTGARCPIEKRESIIELAGHGYKPDFIRRHVNVHRETIINVLNEFAAEIADYDRRLTAKQRRCKWALLDRIEREVDSIPRQALGITYKIVSDQEATDAGRAIARVDHVHRIDLFTDFPDFVRELEARPLMDEKNGAGAADRDAQAQTIHLAGGKNLLPNGEPADVIDVQPLAVEDPWPGAQCDWKSEDLPLPTQATQANTPTFTPDLGPKPAAIDHDQERAGGGSAAGAPPNPTKDNGSLKFSANGD